MATASRKRNGLQTIAYFSMEVGLEPAMPEKHMFTFPLLIIIHIFMGISMAGVTLASGNIGLKLAPKGGATAYLAANSLVNSLGRD